MVYLNIKNVEVGDKILDHVRILWPLVTWRIPAFFFSSAASLRRRFTESKKDAPPETLDWNGLTSGRTPPQCWTPSDGVLTSFFKVFSVTPARCEPASTEVDELL